MNGVISSEPDDSEFVEVDPTGRYGRVSLLISSLFYHLFILVILSVQCVKFVNLLCSIMKFLGKEHQRLCKNILSFQPCKFSNFALHD